MALCYPGQIPVTDEERIAIWRWAKLASIDKGEPIDKVSDAINQRFFNGQAKPEWISDILSGRKTPFRELATDAWKKQYNRRQITAQAKQVAGRQAMSSARRAMETMWNFPRSAAVFGHGLVFPVTHAGDLMLRPASWGNFMKGFLNTWTKTWPGQQAEFALMMNSMERNPRYDLALRSGLDIGERSHINESFTKQSTMGARAWSALTVLRFDEWNRLMDKATNSRMTQEETLEVGKHLAEWSNHATGSAKGPIASLGGNVLFGPKLVQSKLNRMFSDPAKTLKTFSNWGNATAGEKAVALTRLSGLTQYFGMLAGTLALNYGVNKAMGKKDDENVNWTDATKGDFLAFKVGGMEFSVPGLHTEIKGLGKILATSYMAYKWADPKFEAQQKALGIKKPFPPLDPLEAATQWGVGKLNPAGAMIAEGLRGKDYSGHPLPWSPDPGKPSWPRQDWWQYTIARTPIPLSGPIRYFYDHMKQQGASATDATTITKSLIMFGAGLTGMHVSPDYKAEKAAMPQTPQQIAAQKRAANLLLRQKH